MCNLKAVRNAAVVAVAVGAEEGGDVAALSDVKPKHASSQAAPSRCITNFTGVSFE